MRDLTTSRVSSKVLKDAFIGATAFVLFALFKEGAVEFPPVFREEAIGMVCVKGEPPTQWVKRFGLHMNMAPST